MNYTFTTFRGGSHLAMSAATTLRSIVKAELSLV